MKNAGFSVEKPWDCSYGPPLNFLKLHHPSMLKNSAPICSPPPFLQYISMLLCFVRNLLMAGTFLGRAELFSCFLWQINPRPFLVTISVGCIPIKLFLLGFYFLYNKDFSLVHSVPSLSGPFRRHRGLAQLALHNGLSGFWQCLLMATWPCHKELQGTAVAFVCLWSQPLIILSRSMRIAELVTLILANTAVDVVSPCKHPIPF